MGKTIYMDKRTFDLYKRINEQKIRQKRLNEAYYNDDLDLDVEGGENEMGEGEDQSNSLISNIREMSLNGIKMFANNVGSKQYDFFKKVWLMCDKVMNDDQGQAQD